MNTDRNEMRDRQAREVAANFDAFKRLEPDLPPERDGQYALMRGGEIIGFHPDAAAAYHAGLEQFEDRIFSLQEVRAAPLDFGWFSQFAGVWDDQSAPDHSSNRPVRRAGRRGSQRIARRHSTGRHRRRDNLHRRRGHIQSVA